MAMQPQRFGARQRDERRHYKGPTYDRQWRKVREARRGLNPLCQWCEAAGVTAPCEIVDHVIPVHAAPELRLDLDNTQSLCRRCHAVKTAQDVSRYGSATAGGGVIF